MLKKYFFFLMSLCASINVFAEISSYDSQKLTQFAASALSTMATINNTFELAVKCHELNIPGDFVECGVAAGAQVAAMAYACQKFQSTKKVHLFDSFEGIPLAGPNDDQQPGIGAITHNVNMANLNDLLVSSGVSVCSLEGVKANMARWNIPASYLMYHKGWFQHTLPITAHTISEISFLRLDGDLYESTKVCLEYLYPKITKGGYIVIDDYALTGCRKAVEEYLRKHNIFPNIIEIVGGLGPVYWRIE